MTDTLCLLDAGGAGAFSCEDLFQSQQVADTVRLREDLNFTGIRFVAVSQGIDSDDEQADVMMTVHGLVDSLYIKELAKKTHRGLEGLALKGFHTGGSCFGYRSEKLAGGSQLQIVEEEAAVVRRIFHMSASGLSLKLIAKELNAGGIPPPRGTNRAGFTQRFGRGSGVTSIVAGLSGTSESTRNAQGQTRGSVFPALRASGLSWRDRS